MNRDLVRVLKQTRASPRFTINEQPRRGTRHMLLLHRVRTFARTEFPQRRSDFSTNRSTRSHRVETFNRTLPQSREGGQESRRKHPPPPPLPLFLLEEQSKILAKEIVPPANFFLSSTNRRLSFQKGGKSEPKSAATPSAHLDQREKKKKRNYELKVDR